MKPFVSIITPTFNHEKYISTCIGSVQRQSYRDWEMIIVDDCSDDRTSKLIENFCKMDKRIILIKHRTRWGINKLRKTYNQALRVCRGEIVAILEGDDFWPPNKLERQIIAFKKELVVLSFGDWALTDSKGVGVYIRHYHNFDYMLLNNFTPPNILLLFLSLHFDIVSSTVLIRKNALKEIGGFQNDSSYPFIDIPTYLALATKGPFSYCNEIVGYYRRTMDSSWFNFASKSYAMGREEIRNCINVFIKRKAFTFSKSLDWAMVEKGQRLYLQKKEQLWLLSFIFNTLLFRPQNSFYDFIIRWGNKICYSASLLQYKIKRSSFHKFFCMVIVRPLPQHNR